MTPEMRDKLNRNSCGSAIEYIEQLEKQNAELRGIIPEIPPRPPSDDGLPRYGIRWIDQQMPLALVMDDGYWTPYHLAFEVQKERDALAAQVELLLLAGNELRKPWDLDKLLGAETRRFVESWDSVSKTSITKWFVHDPETGFETFNNYSEAKEFADGCIDDYLHDCWAEEVEGLCIGVITHQATKTNIKSCSGEEFDYTCDYELLPIGEHG